MRYFVTLLFAALSVNAVGQIQSDFPYNLDAENNESSFHKSQWVNLILGDISYESAFGHKPDATTDNNLRIRTHLEYVENLLRNKNVSDLSTNLQTKRNHLLDLLHDYWTNGVFPKNYDYVDQRKPCFIDKDGTICAVGYLLEQTTSRQVADEINNKHKYDELLAMNSSTVDNWILTSGLTKEECAMIQPTYDDWEGCTIPSACNYDPFASYGDEFCEFTTCVGCTDTTACNYAPYAYYDDGSCDYSCVGCTDETACNYDLYAYYDDGSCDYSTCVGCTDETACNYDETATLSNNITCTYPEMYYDCDGNLPGCMDADNPGFNPSANVPDPDACLVAGCLIPIACNYDADAEYIDISLCEFASCIGCTDVTVCNYDPTATISSAALCIYPTYPYRDCDEHCYNDSDGDDICDEYEIAGCTDLAAVNYNPFATDDDGSCIIQVGGCVIPFACNYDPDADYYLPGSCDFSCL
jgi:hypothetical protein